ncbi:MAG: hypothetical protein L6Q35_10735 [Phycisphaerales bacterium]|nr:hypothetical protein [Phycisphaerales bacterium]
MTTMLVSAPSHGSVVVFDNSDNQFFWEIGIKPIGAAEIPGTFLDITQPPSQSGERRPGTLGKWYRPNESSDSAAVRYLIGELDVQTARTTDLVKIKWSDDFPPYHVWATRDYLPGEHVGEDARWDTESPYFFHEPFSSSLDEGASAVGDPAYLGVRVKMADNQWHYGWIYFTEYKWPAMWAYETEPNTPIQVPVPGPSIGMSAMVGVFGLCSRRNRKS